MIFFVVSYFRDFVIKNLFRFILVGSWNFVIVICLLFVIWCLFFYKYKKNVLYTSQRLSYARAFSTFSNRTGTPFKRGNPLMGSLTQSKVVKLTRHSSQP